MGILAGSVPFGTFDWTGEFTSLDLAAAAMSALNGALLCRRPDHFKRITVVGVLLMALLGGIGGGITRDVLVNDLPVALTNPAYLTVCLVAGMVGYRITYARGQLFREGLFELVTSFSLILYAIVGAHKGVNSGLPVLGCVLLATVTATAGRFYVDLSSGVTPKHFVRGEWFVSVAALTGVMWIALFALGMNTWVCAGVAGVTGYGVRVLAMYRGWEEPLAQGPKGVYVHQDRPLLGAKINGKSEQELRALGLWVDNTEPDP
jgi:uncharacterized membrane protein YeiH